MGLHNGTGSRIIILHAVSVVIVENVHCNGTSVAVGVIGQTTRRIREKSIGFKGKIRGKHPSGLHHIP